LTLFHINEKHAELVASIIRASYIEQVRLLGISQQEYPNFVGFETVDRVKRALERGERAVLLCKDEKAIGTVRYYIDKQNPSKGYLKRLAVLPEFRGNDYGKTLVQFAEEKLQEQGVKEIEISIVKQFTKLESYYHSLGYRFLRDQTFNSLPFEVRFLTKPLESKITDYER
jgi:ribosomal protein S18 acetylase RimI-like enzyme